MYSEPLAYFLTFTTYGTWLHGDKRGSFKKHDGFIEGNNDNHSRPFLLKEQPVVFSAEQRVLMDRVIIEVCHYRGWELHAKNVRTNHIHVVVMARNTKPEKILNDFKSRGTKILRDSCDYSETKTIWTKHGSTIYLFTEKEFDRTCHYVTDCQ